MSNNSVTQYYEYIPSAYIDTDGKMYTKMCGLVKVIPGICEGTQPLFAFISRYTELDYKMFGGRITTRSIVIPEIFKEFGMPAKYNVAFVNLYPHGGYHIPPHRDTTHDMDQTDIISYTLYETGDKTQSENLRTFVIEDNNKNIVASISMEHGSEIIMHSGMQQLFKHSVPPSNATCGRINITFRLFL